MWGLVLKDLFSMRKYLKSLAIVVGILLIMGLCMGEAAFVAGCFRRSLPLSGFPMTKVAIGTLTA